MLFTRVFSACLAAAAVALPVAASPILLRSGEIDTATNKQTSAPALEGYVLLQLDAVPVAPIPGVTLLRYVPTLAWWAKVEPGALAAKAAAAQVTFAVPAADMDKVEPALRERVAKNKGPVDALVMFLPGVAQAEAEAGLRAVGATVQWRLEGLAQVTLPSSGLDALNAVPGVEWVSGVPGPDKSNNVISAQRIKVDTLKAAPYNLDGTGITFGLWEAEGVPFAHDDIKEHLTIVDTGSAISDHATHVAGTLIGTGANAEPATGMAPGAYIRAFTAEGDIPEMRSNALGGLTQLSNHSYGTRVGWDYDGGWIDYGTEFFGAYSALSYFWDDVVGSTQLVVFKSAGNDRNDDPDGSGPLGDGPYDTIEHRAASKNIITMGALEDDDDMASFSSWGPADDGRVKPDLCANGVGLFSTLPDNDYGVFSGTSMSSPSGCGAGALLYQHYRNTNSADPKAATLKALMIHGAKDLGRPGPDYNYGWGIINAEASARLITDGLFREGRATTTSVTTYQVQVPENVAELKATLVWTDVPGSPSAALALVNDLDLRIVGPDDVEYLPFVLDKANPESDATTGRNAVDNVEQVIVPAPASGQWRIEVRGFLVPAGPQPFTVVTEGFGDFLGSEEEGGTLEGEGAPEAEGGSEEGEGTPGGCASAPIVVDFCADFKRVKANTLLQQLDPEFQPLVQQLDPSVADINGIYFVDLSDLEHPIIQVQGNGLLDAGNELALLQQILADPCFDNGRVTHAQVRAAWLANQKQLLEKQIGPLAPTLKALVRGLDNILVAYTVLGDGQVFTTGEDSASGQGSFGIVAGLFHIIDNQIEVLLGQGFLDSSLDPADFKTVPALQADKNADRDNFTNLQEYAYYPKRVCAAKDALSDYPIAALRTDIFPGSEIAEGEGVVDGEGIAEGISEGEGALEGMPEGEGAVQEGEGMPEEGEGDAGAEGEGEGEGDDAAAFHSADTVPDHIITLAELLRPIQFYNADGFSCSVGEGGEDGYVAAPGDCSACAAYTGDYEVDSPCKLTLSELLRLIQLFNVGSYHACDSPDGFCPGIP